MEDRLVERKISHEAFELAILVPQLPQLAELGDGRLPGKRRQSKTRVESRLRRSTQERTGPMKRSKFSEEQVAYALREVEAGTPVGDVCRQLGVSEATFYAWKKKYAHLGVSELRRLRQLEDENGRLKRLVADLTLDKHMLSEALRKNA